MEHSPVLVSQLKQVIETPLEVRSVTLGVQIADCSERNLHRMCESIYQRITEVAGRLAPVCAEVSSSFGVPIMQRRLAVTPIEQVAHGFGPDDLVHVARTLDGAAANVHVDRISGYSVDVRRGMSNGARQFIASLPLVLSQTTRVRAAVQVASSDTGVNMDAVQLVAHKLRETAEASSERGGDAAAKLSVVANYAMEHPHLTGAVLPSGSSDLVLFVGVGAAGAIRAALERRLQEDRRATWQDLAGEIQSAAFQAIRAAEVVGRELADRLGADFGSVDCTLAPTLRPGDSVAGLLPLLGVGSLGGPGTLAALVLLVNAVRTAAGFASCSASAHTRVMLSVLEDPVLIAATQEPHLTFDQLARLAGAGVNGLDLLPIPGDTDAGTLTGILADQMALAVLQRRPSSVRVIPVPGKKAGDRVSYGSHMGEAGILEIPWSGQCRAFMDRTGMLPPPRS